MRPPKTDVPLMVRKPTDGTPKSSSVKVVGAPKVIELKSKRTGKTYEITAKFGDEVPQEIYDQIEAIDDKIAATQEKERKGQAKLAASGTQLGGPKTREVVPKKKEAVVDPDAEFMADSQARSLMSRRPSKVMEVADALAPVSKAVGELNKKVAAKVASELTFSTVSPEDMRANLSKTAADPKNPMSGAANVAKGLGRFGVGAANPVGYVEFGLKALGDPLVAVKGATVDQVAIALDPSKPIDQRTEAWLGIATLLLPLGVKGAPKLAKAANAVKFAKELGINPIQAGKILNELDKVIASEPQLKGAVEKTQYASPANAVPVETPAPGTSGPTRRPTISRGPGKTVLKKRKPTMIPEVVPDTPAPVVTTAAAVNAVPQSPQLATFTRPGTNNPLLPSEIPDANLANYITEAQARLNEAQKTRPPEEVAVIANDLNKLKAEQAKRQAQPAPTKPVPVAPETPVAAPEPATPIPTPETPVKPPTPIVEPVTVPETPGKPIDPTGAPQLVTTKQGELLQGVAKEPVKTPSRRRATAEEKSDVVQTGKRGEPGVTAGSNLGQKDVLQSVGLDPLEEGARGKKASQEDIANAFTEKTLEAAVERINKQVADGTSIDRLSDAEIQNLAVQSQRVADAMDDLNRKLGKVGNDLKRKQVYQDDFDAAKEKLIAYTKAARATGSATARALAARNAAILDDYSTVGLYNRMSRATDGNITPEVEARVKDAETQAGSKDSQGKSMGDIQDEIAAIEKGNTRKRAEGEFNETAKDVQAKGRRASTKEQKAVITARLKATALEALAAAKKAGRPVGPQNLGLQSLSDAIVAVAPYVKQMVKDAVELGAVSFKGAADIVRKQFEDAGFDLTEDQVAEVLAGVHDGPKEPKPRTPLGEIKKEARDIISAQRKAIADAERKALAEAKKLERDAAREAERVAKETAKQREAFVKRQEAALRANDAKQWRKEQAEQAKIERKRIADARKQGRAEEAAARREYKEFWQNSVEGRREQLQAQIDKVGGGPIGPKKPPKNKFEDDPEVRRLNIELETKKLAIDREINKIEQERVWREMTPAERAWERFFYTPLNVARTVRASFDFGAAANQGWFYSLSHPLKSAKYLGESIVRGWTRTGTDKVLSSVRQDPYFDKARAGKLGIDAVYGDRIDDYLNVSEKITEFGGAFNPIGVSTRAMDIYLARVRMDMFKEYAKSLEKGKTLTLKDYKEIAEVVNTLTGTNRYNLGQGGKIASATLFAPKYMISRIETGLMTPVLKNMNRNPKLALKAAGDYLKGSVSLLALKFAADALLAYNNPDKTKEPPKTDTDPRSSKFMTATANNIEAKLPGNLLQVYQVMRQMTEKQINAGTGVPYQNGKKLDTTMKIGRDGKPRPTEKYSDFTAKDAMGAVTNYLGGKVAPGLAIGLGLLDGERFGKPFNLDTNKGRINVMMSFAPILGENGRDIMLDKRLSDEQKALTIFNAVFNFPVQPTFDKEKYAKPKPPPKL